MKLEHGNGLMVGPSMWAPSSGPTLEYTIALNRWPAIYLWPMSIEGCTFYNKKGH